MNQKYLYIIIAILVVIIFFLLSRKAKDVAVNVANNNMLGAPYVKFSEVNVPGACYAIVQNNGAVSIEPPPDNSTTITAADLGNDIASIIVNGVKMSIVKTSGTYENNWNQNQVFSSTSSDPITSITLYPVDNTVSLKAENIKGYIPFSLANVPEGFFCLKFKNGEIMLRPVTASGLKIDVNVNNPLVSVFGRRANAHVTGILDETYEAPGTFYIEIPPRVLTQSVVGKSRP